MGAKILTGTSPDGTTGAVLFDSNTHVAFGPLFKDHAEAARFLSFIAEVDATNLSWTGSFADGPVLLAMWKKAGRAAQRPAFQFDESFLYKKDARKGWGLSCSFVEHCFPLFLGLKYGNNDVGELLVKKGLASKEEVDTEHGCVYLHFKTKRDGQGFIERVNAWLRNNWHQAYPKAA